MAEFVAYNERVEVNNQTVASIVNSMERGQDNRRNTLLKNHINLTKGEWFKQQDFLNSFRDIANELGEMNLFLIGKAIIDNAKFPPIDNLHHGLQSIDVAYHMNHRLDGVVMFNPATGEKMEGIGHYSLVAFDEAAHTAKMVCTNPYPSKFDEGIITQIVRKFKPPGGYEKVVLDETAESRKNGGNSCTYHISW